MRRTTSRRIALTAAVLAGLAAPLGVTSAATAGTAAPALDTEAAPVAQPYLTTIDRANLLEPQDPVPFEEGASDLTTITVDPEREYQTMRGFGASITDSSASVLMSLPADERDRVMRQLFDPEEGIGVSLLRQPIGSSDFTARPEHYTFDDVAPGRTDFLQRRFSIAPDEEQILPLLRRAKELNPDLTIVATPWSQPAWMKTNGSLVGGQLKSGSKYTLSYAAYLTRVARAYARAGVPIDYLTVQNEPQNRRPLEYPGTDMPVARQAAVIRALGPMLRVASPGTKILGYDHNWSTHPDDIATTPAGRDPETDYPGALLETEANRWIAGTAFHCYYGDPSAQTALHDRFPDKEIWFTECSGSRGVDDPPAQVFADTLKWHARNITIGVTRNWSTTTANWNIALNEDGGPHLGGCDTCTGLVTRISDGSTQLDAEYFTIGHLSKFVHPGAVRIASTSFGTTGWNGQLMDVAFRNPDGSTALVVHNENDAPRSFAVAIGEHSFEYELPGGALATFTWPASAALDDDLAPVVPDGWTATGTTGADTAALAVDDDASTRWSTGRGREEGDALTVDLGASTEFRRVAIDAGDNLGDAVTGWRLETSADGVTWSTAAEGEASGQLAAVDLDPTTARWLRVTATSSSGSWWSVADLRLYR